MPAIFTALSILAADYSHDEKETTVYRLLGSLAATDYAISHPCWWLPFRQIRRVMKLQPALETLICAEPWDITGKLRGGRNVIRGR